MTFNTQIVVFSNPCKRCITRPVCRKECDDFKNHETTTDVTLMLVLLFISTILEWYLVYKLIIGVNIYFKISIILLIISGILFSYKSLKRDGDLTHHWSLNILLILINHIGEFLSFLLEKTGFDDFIINFRYRFIKHLNKY